jgi:hypothetical protein
MARGQALALGDQAEQHVRVSDLIVAAALGLGLGALQHRAGPLGEAAQPPGGREVEILRLAGHEPLLDRLLGHAHVLTDLGPRRAGASGTILHRQPWVDDQLSRLCSTAS